MNIHPVDVSIIIAYLIIVVILGIWLSKKASANIRSYFLGGQNLPWYILGISNVSGMFDITGTMWLVYLLFIYGLKSAFIPWLWPTFNQVFLMIYLAVWLRRSNVVTGAEWIKTRFGDSKGSELAHIAIVIFALVSVIGFLSYAFQGIGKFAQVLLPWDFTAQTYALIFMGVTTVYVILGGMYSVVLTDLIQFIILTAASIFIAAIAMNKTTPEMISAAVPDNWHNLSFGWRLDLEWTGLIDSANAQVANDGYNLFTIFMMMVLFKGILASMAGPAPNYDMQRILAAKNPRESALMSGFVSVVLFFPRYLLIAGITVLALVFYSSTINAMGTDADFEQILPYVLNNFIPPGLLGLVIAGLLAAFMSTFDSTVNAGAAYIVNDIYKRYIDKNAPQKRYVIISYLASIIIVITGIMFGYMTESINSVLGWIVAGLYGGYIAPNVLKWHWQRLNGYGYCAGMLAGIACSLVFPKIMPNVSSLNAFPLLLAISALASVLVSLVTKPESDQTLKSFYKSVRPWGFWKSVREKVVLEDPAFEPNKNFKSDCFNVAVGIIWQLTFTLTAVYIVIKDFKNTAVCLAVMAITSVILKFTWYDKLPQK